MAVQENISLCDAKLMIGVRDLSVPKKEQDKEITYKAMPLYQDWCFTHTDTFQLAGFQI